MEDLSDEDDIFFDYVDEDAENLDSDSITDEDPAEDPAPQPVQQQQNTGKGRKKGQVRDAPARLPCSKCGKTYANSRTLATHLKSHALKEAATRAPDLEDLQENMSQLCSSALDFIVKKLTVGELAQNCASYAAALKMAIRHEEAGELMEFLSTELSSILKTQNAVFLAGLRSSFTVAGNKLLNSDSFRSELKEKCLASFKCPPNVMNFFIGNFIMRLVDQILMHSSLKMQSRLGGTPVVRKKRSRDNTSSENFKEVVHYVSGAVIRAIFRREKKSKKNKTSLSDILRENFLQDKESANTSKSWTAAQDRGRLLYLNQSALDFFVALIAEVMCHEMEDGSVLLQDAIQGVASKQEILNMWDMLVGQSIEEDCSLGWLTSVVEIVSRVVSKGIIKRRLNASTKKSYSSAPLRHKLAR